MKCQTLIVFYYVAMATADDDYDNKLTKLWSLSSASSDGSSVFNVTSASIVIQPSNYPNVPARAARTGKVLPYAYGFKPRAIPLRREDRAKNNYYTDGVQGYKSEVLFPGNYYGISKEKSNETEQFRPQAIPLIRNEEFQKRSLDMDEEPIIERPAQSSEASRRSISDMFNVEDDEDDAEDEDGEYEVEEIEDQLEKKKGTKYKPPKVKTKKLKKYMLPLLLAYKMKYFALVPVMISGLVLLVGATGMAGFFFALFAAVMGLQKGSY